MFLLWPVGDSLKQSIWQLGPNAWEGSLYRLSRSGGGGILTMFSQSRTLLRMCRCRQRRSMWGSRAKWTSRPSRQLTARSSSSSGSLKARGHRSMQYDRYCVRRRRGTTRPWARGLGWRRLHQDAALCLEGSASPAACLHRHVSVFVLYAYCFLDLFYSPFYSVWSTL